ncbi:MAG: SpoIVB peptidase S55 domain-containing protein [Acidobacteriota bacterium]
MGWTTSLAGVLAAGTLLAQGGFFPLREVRAGMKGTGRTVFAGDQVEQFGVEILGVLENVGPKQSLVLARLSGGPLEKTGVLQGMSGSPVYVEGRLLGAVAMAFPFSKEPLAAIRPIHDLLNVAQPVSGSERRARVTVLDRDLAGIFPPPQALPAGGEKLADIATPVSFSGFTRNAVERFAPQLRALGLEPHQGVSGGGRPADGYGDPARLKPGSMITVQLLSGDMSLGADGTVTHIDGKRVYAFGHRFLSIGSTELPFARAEVLTLLPTLSSSFKISAPREWMGTITEDRSTGVAGELGRRTELAPVVITVARPAGGKRSSYTLGMVRDRLLSPLLLQMAVYSAIDATEQALGSSTIAVRGRFEFQSNAAPVLLNNMYAGDMNLPMVVSASTAVPLAYVLQSGFDALRLKKVALEIDVLDRKRQWQIEQAWISRREVRPGESVELTVVLSGENGAELSRRVSYTAPVGAPAGPLHITVADAATANLAEYQQLIGTAHKSAAQLVSFVNSLRPNTRAYVRVARAEPGYDVLGQTLPHPPPSVALILARSQSGLGGGAPAYTSKVAELVIDAGDMVVTGSKTIQVEVKE